MLFGDHPHFLASDHLRFLVLHHLAGGVALLALMDFRLHPAVLAHHMIHFFFGNHTADGLGNFLFHGLGH